MRLIILTLAWVTPAMIAEILGWKGIWGSGSAFGDALIPIPVAGGCLHVVSFCLSAAIVYREHRLPNSIQSIMPIIAGALFMGMIALQIDYDRLNAYLFSDYQPYGSPVRLDSNLLYLFITTDAFWVWLYTLFQGRRPPAKLWAVIPIVPVCVICLFVVQHRISGPKFEIGGSFRGKQRGQEIKLIYTSAKFDKEVLLTWFESKSYLARPWQSPNSEQNAVIFTTSMQAIKWRNLDLITPQNTIATICLYEEDKSMILYQGYTDCFSKRDTVADKLKKILAANPTGFGKNLDHWYARVLLCKDVKVPENFVGDIVLYNTCKLLGDRYDTEKQRFINRFGKDSNELRFIESVAQKYNLK
nr:hypothetical protein [uncultured Desulfobacter sp.]